MLMMALSLLGLDLVTSLTCAVSAISNVGPGLGDIVGPSGNFATLPATAKWLLCIGMLIGRLEVITVLVIFLPAFWRH
jgi:trk system potassium uptake protein TrkH